MLFIIQYCAEVTAVFLKPNTFSCHWQFRSLNILNMNHSSILNLTAPQLFSSSTPTLVYTGSASHSFWQTNFIQHRKKNKKEKKTTYKHIKKEITNIRARTKTVEYATPQPRNSVVHRIIITQIWSCTVATDWVFWIRCWEHFNVLFSPILRRFRKCKYNIRPLCYVHACVCVYVYGTECGFKWWTQFLFSFVWIWQESY